MAYQPYKISRFVISLVLLSAFAATTPAFGQMVGPPSPEIKPEGPKSVGEAASQMKNKMLNIFKPKPMDSEAPEKYETHRASPAVTQSQRVTPSRPQPQAMPKRAPLIQAPALNAKIDIPQVSDANPPMAHPTLDDPNNPLGITAAQKQLNQISQLISNRQWITAKQSLTPLRQWLIDATEIHIDLYKTLSKVSSARTQAEFEKQIALKFGMLRDEALFHQGRILIGENKRKEATKMLTEVIKSQPRSDIGVEAYNLLQQIGFTEKLQLAQ